jgi:aspartate aminotransferase
LRPTAVRWEESVLARRLSRITPSATLGVANAARELRRRGIDVVDLSVGEPNFPTPEHVKEAGRRAIAENQTRYTANPGTIELRTVIAEKLERDHGLTYDPSAIIVSNGAKQSIFNALAALVSEGDRVVIPAPYWVSYPEMVHLVGGEPVIVPTSEERGFKLDPHELGSHLDGAKVLIMNSPSNPTGAVYTPDELRLVVAMAVERGVWVVSDEIYEKLVYGDARFRSAAEVPGARERTVLVNGVSKAYAMTGWRIGYAAAPPAVTGAMEKIQSHTTSNPCSISQAAALAAISGPQDTVREMAAAFAERRDLVHAGIGRIRGWRCASPDGAFYAFPNVTACLGTRVGGRTITDAADLATYLIEEAHVALVPGDGFGAPGHIRLSYAAAPDRLEVALSRLADAMARLEPAT